MSNLLVRRALEKRLETITPPLATSWENIDFKPVSGVPYQEVKLLFAEPDNPVFGDNFHIEQGYMQVSLRYPIQKGNADIGARAELIRSAFKRGNSLVEGVVTVMIDRTPSIGVGFPDGDRYQVPVKIRWYSHITS